MAFLSGKKGRKKTQEMTRGKSAQPDIPGRCSDPEAWDVHSLDWGDVLLVIPSFHGCGPKSVTFFCSIWEHRSANTARQHRENSQAGIWSWQSWGIHRKEASRLQDRDRISLGRTMFG